MEAKASMAVLRIVKLGHEALSRRARPITAWDAELEGLVRDMEQTMHAARGIGLAANQVGLPHDLAIIDLDPGTPDSKLWVLANAVIVETSGRVLEEEGCLSLPGLVAAVPRPERVVARFRDLRGDEQVVDATGLMARALCHELDHLAGMLFPSRVPGIRGDMIKRKARKLQRSGAWDDVHP